MKTYRKKFSIESKYKRNEQIAADVVKVVEEGVGLIGVMSKEEALALARSKELDLVEIAPHLNPPVCKLIDWSKFKYEYSKKEKKVVSKASQLKEVWFRPTTGKGDVDRKVEQIKEFLKKRNKVKITIKPSKGKKVADSFYVDKLNAIIEALNDVGVSESQPRFEGRGMSVIIRPKK